MAALSAGPSDVCTREGDLTWDIAVRFDGGDYVAAIFPQIFAGDVVEGETKVFRVGVDSEPGAVICVTTQLARHKTDRQRQAVFFGPGRHAVTRARVLERFGTPPALALLECRLETGRTHQIRVHMAHIGHGLVGDPVYGGRRKLAATAVSTDAAEAVRGFGRQALHAAELGFAHPVSGDWMAFEADLPGDMAALLDTLRA